MRGEPQRLTARELCERGLARMLAALPPHVQVRLSGKPPVVVDGETLAAHLQLSLAVLERRGLPPMQTQPPALVRSERRRLAAVYAGRPASVAGVEELLVGDSLPARHYAPPEPGGPHPLLVYYHGGGFTFGDLETHDGVCRLLCRHAGAHVLAIDYRLAPEEPYPAAVEDARRALDWAAAHAGDLGADAGRIGVAGDSAGGNLAAVMAQLAAREGGPRLALQLLIYPVTDVSTRRASRELFGEGFLLTSAEMDWFEANYIGTDPERRRDPQVSPLLSATLSGLAPAIVVTAGMDPLRDEGEEYAAALRAAGTRVAARRFAGFIHGFINLAGVSRECREAVIEIAAMTRAAFALAGDTGAPTGAALVAEA